jgi:hypothetical protein
MIKTPKGPTQEQMVKELPDFIRTPIKNGERFILLDDDKLAVYHYMKHDWQSWAYPITFSVLDDLSLYQMYKKADKAALRGIISHIRLWKLGNVDKEIVAGEAAFQRLEAALSANKNAATMDLIWDDCIELTETGAKGYEFLGESKYKPTLAAIYAAYGIPPALVGGDAGGASANAVSLKPFLEKLEYGRDLLTDFWMNEIRLVKEAIGDKEDAVIMYEHMNVYDEAAEQMVWVQLIDRDIVSATTMQEKFGLSPTVEKARLRQVDRMRKSGKVPAKAGPFHNDSQHDNNKELAALNQGTVAPTEVGVKKQPKVAGDKSLLEHNKLIQKSKNNTKVAVKTGAKPKGKSGQGRPKNAKDTTVRKRRVVKASSNAVEQAKLANWAKATQKIISDTFTPIYLERCMKKNVRSLSAAETQTLEQTKFNMLWNLEPMSAFSMDNDLILSPLSDEVSEMICELSESIYNKKLEELGVEDARDLQINAYVLYRGQGDDDGEIDS